MDKSSYRVDNRFKKVLKGKLLWSALWADGLLLMVWRLIHRTCFLVFIFLMVMVDVWLFTQAVNKLSYDLSKSWVHMWEIRLWIPWNVMRVSLNHWWNFHKHLLLLTFIPKNYQHYRIHWYGYHSYYNSQPWKWKTLHSSERYEL